MMNCAKTRVAAGLLSVVIGLILAAVPVAAFAATDLEPSAVDSCGGRLSGGDVVMDSSVGAIVEPVSASGVIVKSGYAGQLYDLVALQVTASPTSLNENATRQLSAAGLYDDDTLGGLVPGDAQWRVADGPLILIDTAGLASSGEVYEDTPATAEATYAARTGTIGLLVLNIDPDNYGTYAGDMLPDNWQVGYFGTDNVDAAPDADPDGDGQSNMFEYVIGTLPTNEASKFALEIAPVPGQPLQMDVIYDPVFPDRSYEVEYSLNLAGGAWSDLQGESVSTNGLECTARDLTATNLATFYRVNVQYSP